MVYVNDFDLVFIIEFWLNNEILDLEILLWVYDLYCCDCDGLCYCDLDEGGGVLIVCCNSI